MSKIQMLLNKTKGEHTVFSHVNENGTSFNFKRTVTILEDWALNTMVRFQIMNLLKEAFNVLNVSSDTLVARGIDIEKCRFQLHHAGWDRDGWTPGRYRESQCLRVRLYPIATEQSILNQEDATYIEIDFSVVKNRITKGRVGKQYIARADDFADPSRDRYDDFCMSDEAWM